jgi:hypothetical protein
MASASDSAPKQKREEKGMTKRKARERTTKTPRLQTSRQTLRIA